MLRSASEHEVGSPIYIEKPTSLFDGVFWKAEDISRVNPTVFLQGLDVS